VEKTKTVCIRASRLVEVHPLTSAAAIQLAAALVLVSDCPAGFEFVTLDERLGEIAEQEGFAIVGATPA
jgi:predicted nucleic acid-binding protein